MVTLFPYSWAASRETLPLRSIYLEDLLGRLLVRHFLYALSTWKIFLGGFSVRHFLYALSTWKIYLGGLS
jgi:hypothetical protein